MRSVPAHRVAKVDVSHRDTHVVPQRMLTLEHLDPLRERKRTEKIRSPGGMDRDARRFKFSFFGAPDNLRPALDLLRLRAVEISPHEDIAQGTAQIRHRLALQSQRRRIS